MESIERKTENNAVIFNVNLLRATLNEAGEFRDLLEEAVLDSDLDIIVNLSGCEHLDSTFLGVLVSCYKKLKSQNRSLVIIEPVDHSNIFLTLNSIGKIFPLYTSVKVALEDIQNKKIIENEIKGLDEESTQPKESEKIVPYRISEKHFNDDRSQTLSVQDKIQKDPKAEKIEDNVNLLNANNDLTHNTFSDNSEEDEQLVLIENKNQDKQSEEVTLHKSEETLKVNEITDLKPHRKNGKKKNESLPKQIIEEKDFRQGTIEWKFGFN